VTAMLVTATGTAMPAALSAAAQTDSIAPADSTPASAPDSVRAIVVKDSLGIPGTLEGEPPRPDPEQVKETLERMGSSEVTGRTQWERKKNPKVAMLCHTLLPGLGQVYNGRRWKVALMTGFASYYYGSTWINYKKWKQAEARRDLYPPNSESYEFQNDLAGFYKEEARTFLWWSGAVWLIGLVDSWIDAHLYDVRSYSPPRIEETVTPQAVNERTNYLTLGFTLEWSQ